jgi:hypothetical protein
MKTTAIPSPAPIGTPVSRSDAAPLSRAAAAANLDEGNLPSRSTYRFFRAVRLFLSRLVDSSAFHQVSLGREISIVFTVNGPLVYRPETNSDARNKPARSSRN